MKMRLIDADLLWFNIANNSAIDTGETYKYATREMLSCCKIVDNIHDNPDFMETYKAKF